jgi:hypothetical protein
VESSFTIARLDISWVCGSSGIHEVTRGVCHVTVVLNFTVQPTYTEALTRMIEIASTAWAAGSCLNYTCPHRQNVRIKTKNAQPKSAMNSPQ